MRQMTDPMNALKSLQKEVKKGLSMMSCELDQRFSMIADNPNGVLRLSYAKIEHRVVKSLAIFAAAERIEGVPCFNVGYAVAEKYRGKGLAKEIVEIGINELLNGFGRNGATEFYIEAVVDLQNVASQNVAKKTISNEFSEIIDSVSGKEALHYISLINCNKI